MTMNAIVFYNIRATPSNSQDLSAFFWSRRLQRDRLAVRTFSMINTTDNEEIDQVILESFLPL